MEAVSVHLIQALGRVPGLDVHVLTTSRRPRAESVTWEGTTVHHLPAGGGFTLLNAVLWGRRIVSQAIARLAPDVVHAHDTFGLMAARVARPRVLTIHGFIYADTALAGGLTARARSRVWEHFETAAWAQYPHVISISPYVRERLRGRTSAVVHDVENPVGLTFFSRVTRPDPATIFSAAVISRRKNTLVLIEALALLHHRGVRPRLRLAGSVKEPEYLAQVRARIASAGLADAVTFIQGLSGDAVAGELERATVFALASLEENAPVGIQEAMAVGVPVLASNRCGMPYQVADGVTGFLIDPEDPRQVADRLERLLRDPGECARMGAAARAAAQGRFHPDVVARQTIEVYQAATGGRT